MSILIHQYICLSQLQTSQAQMSLYYIGCCPCPPSKILFGFTTVNQTQARSIFHALLPSTYQNPLMNPSSRLALALDQLTNVFLHTRLVLSLHLSELTNINPIPIYPNTSTSSFLNSQNIPSSQPPCSQPSNMDAHVAATLEILEMYEEYPHASNSPTDTDLSKHIFPFLPCIVDSKASSSCIHPQAGC